MRDGTPHAQSGKFRALSSFVQASPSSARAFIYVAHQSLYLEIVRRRRSEYYR
jgi:hypothetical protein